MVVGRFGRVHAVRDFILGVAGVSAFGLLGTFLIALNPFSALSQEPFRTPVLAVVGGAWLLSIGGLILVLRRDLAQVHLTETGLLVRQKLIPYSAIESVDPRPGSLVFRLKLLNSGKRLLLSKVGIESEQKFFDQLLAHVGGHREASSQDRPA